MRGAASPSPQIASLLTLTALVVGSGGVVVPAHAGPHADQVEAIESGRLVMPPRTERPYLPPPLHTAAAAPPAREGGDREEDLGRCRRGRVEA